MGVAYSRQRTSLYGAKNFSSPMSQKTRASRRAMVMINALAIISGLPIGMRTHARLRDGADGWPWTIAATGAELGHGVGNLVDIYFKGSSDVVREGDAWQKAPFLQGVDARAIDGRRGTRDRFVSVFCFSEELNTVFT